MPEVESPHQELKKLIEEAREYLKKKPLGYGEDNFSIQQIKAGNRRRLYIDSLVDSCERELNEYKDSDKPEDLEEIDLMIDRLKMYKGRSQNWTV